LNPAPGNHSGTLTTKNDEAIGSKYLNAMAYKMAQHQP